MAHKEVAELQKLAHSLAKKVRQQPGTTDEWNRWRVRRGLRTRRRRYGSCAVNPRAASIQRHTRSMPRMLGPCSSISGRGLITSAISTAGNGQTWPESTDWQPTLPLPAKYGRGLGDRFPPGRAGGDE